MSTGHLFVFFAYWGGGCIMKTLLKFNYKFIAENGLGMKVGKDDDLGKILEQIDHKKPKKSFFIKNFPEKLKALVDSFFTS